MSSTVKAPVLILSIDRQETFTTFKNISDRSFILALLSGIPPKNNWEGSEILQLNSLTGQNNLIHIGIRGASAGEIKRNLVEALARIQISTKGQGDGLGDGVTLARASGRCWCDP